MVVIQFGGRTVKGYSNRSDWPAQEELANFTLTPPICLLDNGSIERIPLEGLKAIFFVKSFEGKWHDDLRFHDHLAAQECLWIRATFLDGEIIEGLITNDSHHVLQDGFYLFPIDPEGNNLLMYVLKKKLKDFQVLGLRAAPRTMPRIGPARTAESLV
jgi:hypothetical protein